MWGGFKVQQTSHRGVTLDASSAGAASDVSGFCFEQRNQQQQVCVYITFGSPTIANCEIIGTVHVAGRAASPTIDSCDVRDSRSVGIDFRDHAGGRVRGASSGTTHWRRCDSR